MTCATWTCDIWNFLVSNLGRLNFFSCKSLLPFICNFEVDMWYVDMWFGHDIFGIWTCHIWTCDVLDMSYLENDDYVQGKWSEWPMFHRDIDSFPFRWISGARYVHFLAKVMPKFPVNFCMTCARIKLGISSVGICCDGNGTTFRQTIDLFYAINHFIIV